MISSIKVRLSFEGIHCWPDAPDEVDFLQNPHRHMFHVALTIQVNHDDRELEFFIVQRKLRSWFPKELFLGSVSCEMLAKDFLDKSLKEFGLRSCSCEVSEDNENSAIVSYP